MENTDSEKPHRVIYTWGNRGKRRASIFPNLAKAQDFASKVKEPFIQLATESPNLPHTTELRNIIRTNKCVCQRNKLTADATCYSCSGKSATLHVDKESRVPARTVFGKSKTSTWIK